MDLIVGSDDGWDEIRDPHESKSLLHSTISLQHRVIGDIGYITEEEEEENDYFPSRYSSSSSSSFPTLPKHSYDDSMLLALCFVLISFGYMVPWTSLGSLISYYKYTYSANFYVKLYCCYYLPGLPVALLQYRYDSILDKKFGSKNMYLLRCAIPYISMILIISSMAKVKEKYVLILMFSLLGVCGWLCHGTATMLASMYPSYAIASLQTGFRCPEIFTLIAVSLLHLGKHITQLNLIIFFALTSFAVLSGLMAWIHLIFNPRSSKYFESKDAKLNSLLEYERSQREAQSTIKSREIIGITGDRISSDYGGIDNRRISNHDNSNINININSSNISSSNNNNSNDMMMRMIKMENGNSELNKDQLSGANRNININDRFNPIQSIPVSSVTEEFQPLGRAKRLIYVMEDINMKARVLDSVFPLTIALYFTMFASIFQASFFAYVDSSGKLPIEQILYFVRLFSDLFGRPLTRLPRPWFLRHKKQLLIAALVRASSMIIFFLYILVPNMPKNDAFIISYVAIFSMLSGYFTVLIYEFASRDYTDKSSQTFATTQLNISFQLAAFTAVLSSVYLTNSGWFEKFLT